MGRLRTVGIQRDTQQVEDEFEFGHGSSRRDGSVDEHDMPLSPFFSGSSSTAWGSSIPSTPGGGTCSPGAIPIGGMSLSSSYNTPRSVNAALADEDEEEMVV